MRKANQKDTQHLSSKKKHLQGIYQHEKYFTFWNYGKEIENKSLSFQVSYSYIVPFKKDTDIYLRLEIKQALQAWF